MKKYWVLLFVWFCFGIGEGKSQFTILLDFNGANGAYPSGSLTISGDKLFGMTQEGGANYKGCIFSIDTNGYGYELIHNFIDSNGTYPYGSLTLCKGILYGMASGGGTNTYGCVFSVDTNGSKYKDMFNCNGADGPLGSLILSGKVLYGMTDGGGVHYDGNIFHLDTNGSRYYDMFDCSGGSNGLGPAGSLILSGGLLYGMTEEGGVNTMGNIFSIDTNSNNYKDLLNFNQTNFPEGSQPEGDLTFSHGRLFGMTYGGGTDSDGCIFTIDTDGSGYKDLFDFKGANGKWPDGSLIFSGGKLFGMTSYGGAYNDGIIFSIDTDGTGYTDIFDFNGSNGKYPMGDLIMSGDVLYGMTYQGGTTNRGVVFSFRDSNIITSNNSVKSRYSINIHPNPNNGIFTIQSSVVSGQLSVEVYNVMGQRVLTEILRSTQDDKVMDISNQPNGVYFYRVLEEDGSVVGSGKVIIQK